MKSRPNTLIIDSCASACGGCGHGANPHESAHDTTLGYWSDSNRPEPCHEPFLYVTSDYSGMEARCREMRPDLEWRPYFLSSPAAPSPSL